MRMRLASIVAVFLLSIKMTSAQDGCTVSPSQTYTDDFYFAASSDQGAPGDVVAIEIELLAETLRHDLSGLSLVACFDDSILEQVGDPIFTESFDEAIYLSHFFRLGGEVGPQRSDGGAGFLLSGDVRQQALERWQLNGEPVPLMTVYFRVRSGASGETALSFCDDAFLYPESQAHLGCIRNELIHFTSDGTLAAASTRHIPCTIRILDGPPTHPDVPDLPPSAKIYPEAPTPETADIRFELTGGVVRPGERDVALDLFITSNLEFSGYSLALNYPSWWIEFDRVEEHIRPGALGVDPQNGYLSLVMVNSRRRVGAEGERVRIATLYFHIKDAAAEAEDVAPWFAPTPFVANWIAVRHEGGLAGDLPVSSEVEPLVSAVRRLRVQTRPTLRGDANFDFELDLSDALAILGALFLGQDPVACPEAADFNGDASRDVSDAVGILQHLFVEARPTIDTDVYCAGGS